MPATIAQYECQRQALNANRKSFGVMRNAKAHAFYVPITCMVVKELPQRHALVQTSLNKFWTHGHPQCTQAAQKCKGVTCTHFSTVAANG